MDKELIFMTKNIVWEGERTPVLYELYNMSTKSVSPVTKCTDLKRLVEKANYLYANTDFEYVIMTLDKIIIYSTKRGYLI